MEKDRIVKTYVKGGKKIVIRYVKESDINDIGEVLKAWYKNLMAKGRARKADFDKKTRDWWLETAAGARDDSAVALVAEIDGNVKGIVEIGIDRTVTLVAEIDGKVRALVDVNGKSGTYSHSAEVGIIVVDKEYGFGRFPEGVVAETLLMSAISEAEKALKLELITLHTNSDNRSAIRLYIACGFMVMGEVPKSRKFYNGEYVGRLTMAKYLPGLPNLPE